MQSSRLITLAFLGMLLLSSLACALSFANPAESVPPAVETAVAQAGDLAVTAAAVATTEGSAALATVIAVVTPHVDFLKEKLANIKPDADGNYRVTLSEEEVNTALRLRQLLTGDVIGAGIQSQKVTFSDGSITLTGSIVEPLPGQLIVKMRPSVVAGRFQLVIEEASVAGKEAPQQALEAAESAISGTLGEALQHLPAGVQLQEVTVTNGELAIVGRQADGS